MLDNAVRSAEALRERPKTDAVFMFNRYFGANNLKQVKPSQISGQGKPIYLAKR